MNNAFALSGRLIAITFPRALPWAKCFWAFSPFAQSYRMKLFLEK